MSTNTAGLDFQLEQADEEVKALAGKLPWYRRFSRKYLTSTSFVSYQVGGAAAWLKFVFGKKLLLLLATKFPLAYSLGATVVDKVVLVLVAMVAIFKEAI